MSRLNFVTNPSFEDGVDLQGTPTGWANLTSASGAVATVDNVRAAIGTYSAKLTVGQVGIGYAALSQDLPANIKFSNLTDSIDNIEFAFYLEPRFVGLGDFAIKVYAENSQELDYVFDADPQLNYPNTTFTDGSGRPFVKSFLLGDLTGTSPRYPAGRWHLFNFRNLRADWQAPMKHYNSTCSPCTLAGFGLNETLSRIELDVIGFRDASTNSYYSATVWVDEVKVFLETNMPKPPSPPLGSLFFKFTDLNNNYIDDVVKWKLFNQTGYEITGYRLGDRTLREETYTIEVYYPAVTTIPEQFLILRRTVPLDPPTPTIIQLPMIRENTGPNDYIAFNKPISSAAITFQDSTKLSFSAVGPSSAYRVHAKVPAEPTVILRNDPQVELTEGGDWTFNSTYSTVTITTTTLGSFKAYFVVKQRIPEIRFGDRGGFDVTGTVSFRISNSLDSEIPYLPGRIPPDENFPYTLQASYLGKLIYNSTLDLSLTTPITLHMLRIDDSPSYIVLNTTVTSITLVENDATRIRFVVQGQGPSLIIINVPSRPLYVEKNGSRTASWTYDSSTGIVAIETETLGTFSLVFSTIDTSMYFLYSGIATAVIVAPAAFLLRRRILRKTASSATQPEPS